MCPLCRFQQEGQRLIMDNVTNVNINNPHFEYLWQVGRADLFDGMTSADQVRSPDKDRVTRMHIGSCWQVPRHVHVWFISGVQGISH
jgi:hypothetical protein